MLFLGIITLLIVLCSWGRQAICALRLALHYPLKPPRDGSPLEGWPPVTVLVPLRGADPMLGDCLRGLCRQDYPDFRVHLIVDSADDPAWTTIREVLAEFPQVRVQTSVLTNRLETCSLKVSALLHGVAHLDPECRVVAHIDADVIPPPHWLRELVRPFEDPKIAAVTGLRWYHTHSCAWGSLVRHLWGAVAASQMYNLEILWGGTLAFRASFVRDPGLQAIWEHSFVEDTSAVAYLHKRYLKLHMLPQLTMINPEAISLAGCFRFIRRQMLCVRLHHPRWRDVLYTAISMTLSIPLALVVSFFAWQQGMDWLAWTILGALLVGVVGTGLPLIWIDGTFFYASPPDNRIAPLRWKHIPVIPVTILVHLLAVLSACWVREIDWRGIRYSVGQGGVRRLDDASYRDPATSADQAESIV
jgi:hypothetical protein